MSHYIVVDLEELKKSSYIVIDLSNIGETSPQITQINLFREVTHSDNPYIVVDLDDLKDQPYIVIDLDDIDNQPYIVIDLGDIDELSQKSVQIGLVRKVVHPQSAQINLIREVEVTHENYHSVSIALKRSVMCEQSTQIELVREIDNNFIANSVNINLIRNVESEQSTSIDLIRDVCDGSILLDFNFAGIGKLAKPGICFDVHCCCLIRKEEIIAKIVEEKPLYVEKTNLNLKPLVFLLIKPANAASIPYEEISDSVSYYEYEILPLFPDRSNKGYKET